MIVDGYRDDGEAAIGGAKKRYGAEAAFWTLVFSLFVLTRVPVMNRYLSIDDVNLAFALEKFDPRIHQPQPPGYPLFVFFTRAVNVLFQDPEKTFAWTSLIVSALCLPLVFALGRRLFGVWAGRAAVFLLLVSPPFWYATLEGPLRPYLALFSLLTAYCCWRCWQGEKSFMLWGAIALGVGSGFRPDLGAYLFPLWLLSAWMGSRSVADVARGLIVLAGVVFAWLAGMAYAVGGLRELYNLNVHYVVNQSKDESVILGAVQRGWLRQISRLAIWNGTPALVSLFVLPWVVKFRERVSLKSAAGVFMLVWLLPGLLFQALVHVEDPGHTLFSIPAVCILAACWIHLAARHLPQMREGLLAAALIFNVSVFLSLFPLPAAGEATGGWHSLKNSFVFAAFETSLGELRYLDSTARQTMTELHTFLRPDQPTIIVTSDVDTANWFMNWRIMRYYAPAVDIWVIADQETPRRVEKIRRDRTLQAGAGTRIPLPRGGRVIWLIEREGPFDRALRQVQPSLPGGAYLSYTDVGADTRPFQVMNVDFVPDP